MTSSHMLLLPMATLAVVISSIQCQIMRVPNNETENLGSGGRGLIGRVKAKQMSKGNSRSLDTNNEGMFVYRNEMTNQMLRFGVRKIMEYDANKTPLCKNRGINMNGNNQNSRDVIRESKNVTDGNVDFQTKLTNNRPSNLVRMTGSMIGIGQQNQFTKGNTTVDVECIMKTDNTTTTLDIGNSSTVIKEGDLKCTMTIQGYEFCQNCTCQDGSMSQGEYLRVYFKAEAGAGKKRLENPAVSSDAGKVRKDAGSKNEKEILPQFDENQKSRPVVTCMETQLADDGTNLATDSVDISAGVWEEKGNPSNVNVPGFWVDIKRVDWNKDTKYIYDPTISYEEQNSTDTGTTGSASHALTSVFVLILAAVLQMLC